ncbi:MAG TPA: hypothetical protein VIJ66_10700 [Solirubrobacteraceae bacterium]
MMIVMKETATPGEIEAVVTKIERAGALAGKTLAGRKATDA